MKTLKRSKALQTYTSRSRDWEGFAKQRQQKVGQPCVFQNLPPCPLKQYCLTIGQDSLCTGTVVRSYDRAACFRSLIEVDDVVLWIPRRRCYFNPVCVARSEDVWSYRHAKQVIWRHDSFDLSELEKQSTHSCGVPSMYDNRSVPGVVPDLRGDIECIYLLGVSQSTSLIS